METQKDLNNLSKVTQLAVWMLCARDHQTNDTHEELRMREISILLLTLYSYAQLAPIRDIQHTVEGQDITRGTKARGHPGLCGGPGQVKSPPPCWPT